MDYPTLERYLFGDTSYGRAVDFGVRHLSQILGLNKPYDISSLVGNVFVEHVINGTNALISSGPIRQSELNALTASVKEVQDLMHKGGLLNTYAAFSETGDFGASRFRQRIFSSVISSVGLALISIGYKPILNDFLLNPDSRPDILAFRFLLFASLFFPILTLKYGIDSVKYLQNLNQIGRLLERPIPDSGIPYGSGILAAAYFHNLGVQGPQRAVYWGEIAEPFKQQDPNGVKFTSDIVDLLAMRSIGERLDLLLREIDGYVQREGLPLPAFVPRGRTLEERLIRKKAAIVAAYQRASMHPSGNSYVLDLEIQGPLEGLLGKEGIPEFLYRVLERYRDKRCWEALFPVDLGLLEAPGLFDSALLSHPNLLQREAALGIHLASTVQGFRGQRVETYQGSFQPGNLFDERSGPVLFQLFYDPRRTQFLIEEGLAKRSQLFSEVLSVKYADL